jgi:hypothetical protein
MDTITVIELEPILGPVCDMQDAVDDSGGCYHDSCQNIECNGRITLAEGPLCAHADYWGYCTHKSCNLINPAQAFCPMNRDHGWQLVVDHGSGRGFAGGNIYWANLACGCFDMDESDDIRAAY